MGKDRLPEIAAASVECERSTGVPAELLAAQCILESGWLQRFPGGNCFGIKAYPGQHGRQLLATDEWLTDRELREFLAKGDGRTAELAQPVRTNGKGRKQYRVQDWFATFASLADCFRKRALLFHAGRYRASYLNYLNDRDLPALVRSIAPIYATDETYADLVLRILQQPDVMTAIERSRQAPG